MVERAPFVLPHWPRCLTREQAAAYLGVSVATFKAELKTGRWPGPDNRGAKGGVHTWDRLLLDAAQDRHSKLIADPTTLADDGPPAYESDVWKERINATAPHQRP